MAGRTVAGCRILKKLGEGGMGVAYSAHHERLDRVVVIKFMYASVAARPGAVESFKREAQAAARLEHPRITQVYDVGTEGQLHYIIMQFIDGENVEELMVKTPVIEQLKALQIIKASLEGLQEAHRHGIVHRDIKPSNIMLGKDGTIRLCDFGLALKTDPAGKAASVEIIGTPYYMSPEQIYGLPVDGRTDIYSMGATYFHMLAGKPPFEGPTPQDIVAMHVHNPVPDIRTLNPDISSGASEVLSKMLAKRPEDRYRDVPDLLQALNSPSMVVASADDMMSATMNMDLGISPTAAKRVPTGMPPVPVPGGMIQDLSLDRGVDGPTDALQEIRSEEDNPRELNPVTWKPMISAALWSMTGASAAAAGTLGRVEVLGATALLTLASTGVAAAGIGLFSVSGIAIGSALLYYSHGAGFPPSLELLAGAGHVIYFPVAVWTALLAMRLATQARKSRATIVGILLAALLSAWAAFYFGLPGDMDWQVLRDAAKGHAKAPLVAGAALAAVALFLFKNRSADPAKSDPLSSALFLTLGLLGMFVAGAINYDPPTLKLPEEPVLQEKKPEVQDPEVLDPWADMRPKSEEPLEAGPTPEEIAAKKDAHKGAVAAVEKEMRKSILRRAVERPFQNFRQQLKKTASLVLFGIVFLLFGILVYWEDARIFEQDKLT